MRLEGTIIAANIILGQHGLYYLTDATNHSIFIAAASAQDAEEYAAFARSALRDGDEHVPRHEIFTHPNGCQITVPRLDPMTRDQRMETVLRLQRHFVAHFECT